MATKLLKYAAYVLGGLVILVIAGVLIAVALVDGAFVKAQLERQMAQDKHRTLAIEGEPRLRFFPVAGISLGRTTLSEPDSQETFVAFDSVEAAIRVAPLFTGTLAIETLTAKGLRVNVRLHKDGHMNFENLQGKESAVPAEPEPRRRAPPKIAVRELNIERARFSYANEITGQELDVADVSVTLGPLADATPSPLSLTAQVTGRRPQVGIQAKASGLVKLDLAGESIALQKLDASITGSAGDLTGLDLRLAGNLALDGRKGELGLDGWRASVQGKLDRDAFAGELSAPQVSVTRDRASGSAVTGTLRLNGPERKLDAKLNVAAAQGSFSSLVLPSVDLDIQGTADGGQLKASIKTPVHANLEAGNLELPKLVADLNVAHPKLPQKSFHLPLEASFKLDRGKQTLSARAAADADEFDFRLQFDARRLAPLAANFDFSSQRLNLDRYPVVGAGGGGGKTDDRVDFAALLGPSIQGKIRIGSLQANAMKLADVAADVRLERGILEAAPHSAHLYGGALNGSLLVDARGKEVRVKENLQGVEINPLLKDLAKRDILEGRGDIQIDVAGSGGTVSAIKRSLAGSARLQLRDGAYKGINLAQILRRAQAAVQGKSAADTSEKTDFSELSASFAIKNGVAHNEDLVLKSPFVRAGGSGNFDIAASTLDYVVKPSLVASATGQQGRDDLAGITVPVHLHGPLDALKYDVDTRALVSSGLRDRVNEKLNERLGGAPAGKQAGPEELRDQVRERLRGLLKR